LLSGYSVQCLFLSPRLSRTGVKESSTCALDSTQLTYSSIFARANEIKVGVRINGTLDIWMQRAVRILPKLTVQGGILEPSQNSMTVWLSSFKQWTGVPEPTFTAAVHQGANSSTIQGRLASRGLRGEYEATFALDYIGRVTEGVQVQISYNISSTHFVYLDLDMSYLQNRREILPTIRPTGEVIVRAADGNPFLGNASNSTYCRFNISKGFAYALATVSDDRKSCSCDYPQLNWLANQSTPLVALVAV